MHFKPNVRYLLYRPLADMYIYVFACVCSFRFFDVILTVVQSGLKHAHGKLKT